MLTTAISPNSEVTHPPSTSMVARVSRAPFIFVAERLWLDFVNTDGGPSALDTVADFDGLVSWLETAISLDLERAQMMRRRAIQQPSGATAALVDARRVRAALRSLAERGSVAPQVRVEALQEINRVLGRSAGTRRLEIRPDGTFARSFVPVGDAFVESAADALILGELIRVRRCADPRCARVFYDGTKNAARRWCDMATCGNRAKAARHRARLKAS
jgi:predicted RNA-binding Zn ribbon-like protein